MLKLDDKEKSAKEKVLEEILGLADKMSGDRLKGLKKPAVAELSVTSMKPDGEEGEGVPGAEDMMDGGDDDSEESGDDHQDGGDDDSKIAELEAQLAALKANRR